MSEIITPQNVIMPVTYTVYDKEHNSHYHLLNLSTTSDTHTHGNFYSLSHFCWADHSHLCSLTAGGNHSHTVVLNTSTVTATDLGHTHVVSSYTYANTYPHTHSADYTWGEHCAVCSDPHTHTYSGTTASYDNNHFHVIAGNTGTGYGTLYWHNHYVGFDIDDADSHTHSGAPTLGTVLCALLQFHSHAGGTIPNHTHRHGIVGYTGYAGEPTPEPTKRTFSPPVL